jgi:hypothetical protein
MIEREMEDLIAKYPDDFFPRKNFKLIGRQESFQGVGRFDLLFADDHESKVLMELKARTLKYEDATQVAGYRDELRRRGQKNIWMWLVAPLIPSSVREFLDDKGIEYTEIHFNEFRRHAQLRGYVITSEVREDGTLKSPAVPTVPTIRASRVAKARISPPSLVEVGPKVTSPAIFTWKSIGYDLMLKNPIAFDQKKFTSLVKEFEAAAGKKNVSLIADLMEWGASASRNVWPHSSNCSLLRWTTTNGSSYKRAVPSAELLWRYLFGAPAPTWYWWDRAEGYKFDPDAWQLWFQSLSTVPDELATVYATHNGEDARNWPADKQCQCKDCTLYRSIKS